MLDTFFSPRGVAVIGASQNPTKLGYGTARNLVVSSYRGSIYFVNPRGGRLFDQPIYPNVASVPDPVDLAIIMIPAASVPDVLEECGQRGIRFAIVGAGGFRGTGPEGEALEQHCLDIARSHNVRVLGPNCIGFLDTHLPINATFLPLPGPIPGDIAFLSHSGAICEAVIDWARGQGFGLSRLVSLGNQMDLNEGDMLSAIATDPNTRVVAMYMEGVGDGPTFIRQAKAVTREKPVVAIKVGLSAAGRAAVASHTGALAGEDAAYEAAFRKAGVIRARHSEEMFDWAQALAWCPLPSGPRIAILTNAGGPGAIAADALESEDLSLAEITEATRDQLKEFQVAGAIIPVIRLASKPVMVALMGEELIAHAARLFRQSHIPDYRFPERAASAMRVLVERSRQLEAPEEISLKLDNINLEAAKESINQGEIGKSGFLDSLESAKVVQRYGIKIPSEILAETAEQAVEAANQLGYPVALKIVALDVPHKSDFGGVVLDLHSPQEVLEGFENILGMTKVKVPEEQIRGVLVQKMIPDGQDVIVGVVRDDQFGPLVMFGSGGVEVEALEDVAFALAPLTHHEVEEMVERTWAGQRLRGYRSLPPADREAVIEVLLRLGQLVVDLPQIVEVEINPLRALPEGNGALALDVRLRLER